MTAAPQEQIVLGTLKERYARVMERIDAAARRAGRIGSDVTMVAVSKSADPEQIRELIQLGQRDFGESQVQQLLQRAAMIDEWLARHRAMPGAGRVPGAAPQGLGLGDRSTAASIKQSGVRWHMIGHLQRNKARKVAEICRMIHSVDSLRLAEELQAIAAKMQADAERLHASRSGASRPESEPELPVVDVLLQVNVAGEGQKFGCSVPAAIHLAEQIDTMIQLRLRGVMVMAPYSENPEDSRTYFAQARELFTEIRDAGIAPNHFNILSMGMSGDFEVAIEEGANMVRVGGAIFGERAGMGADDANTDSEG
ncbi:MAG: YggS family pyridoxal phosphate-dependent enzyme [Phycisphaeraceae bacterium]|nr:YggS family pyridoxal phosphate-dependent enzyme [Phycisphaeraceae bacterium]